MPSDRPKKPHGHFTPANKISRVLSRTGHLRWVARKDFAFGGYLCSWEQHTQRVRVIHRPGDDVVDETAREAEREEMLKVYGQILTEKGYSCEYSYSALYVDPVKKTEKPKPTTEEQITAVGVLRNFAKITPNYANPTAGELAVAEAINTLDKADLFAALDRERDAQQAAQEDRTP